MERVVRLACPVDGCSWSYTYDSLAMDSEAAHLFREGVITEKAAETYTIGRVEAVCESHLMCVHNLSPKEK